MQKNILLQILFLVLTLCFTGVDTVASVPAHNISAEISVEADGPQSGLYQNAELPDDEQSHAVNLCCLFVQTHAYTPMLHISFILLKPSLCIWQPPKK